MSTPIHGKRKVPHDIAFNDPSTKRLRHEKSEPASKSLTRIFRNTLPTESLTCPFSRPSLPGGIAPTPTAKQIKKSLPIDVTLSHDRLQTIVDFLPLRDLLSFNRTSKACSRIKYHELHFGNPPNFITYDQFVAFIQPFRSAISLNLYYVRTGNPWGLDNHHLDIISSRPELRKLSLHQQNHITNEGLIHLTGLHALTELALCNTAINGEGLVHIRRLTSLTKLNISNIEISDASLQYLDGMSSLRDLSLYNSRSITDTGVGHLRRHALTSLNLSFNKGVTDKEGAVYLSEMPSLRHLELSGTSISNEGLKHIRKLPLTDLNLSATGVADEGAGYLSEMPSLRKLDLSCTKITDLGVSRICKLPSLTDLDLFGTELTDKSVIESLSKMKKETKLKVFSNTITTAGMAYLAKRIPSAQKNVYIFSQKIVQLQTSD